MNRFMMVAAMVMAVAFTMMAPKARAAEHAPPDLSTTNISHGEMLPVAQVSSRYAGGVLGGVRIAPQA